MFLAYLTGICGRKSEEDPEVYLIRMDHIYTDVEFALFVGFLYLVMYLCRNLGHMHFAFSVLW